MRLSPERERERETLTFTVAQCSSSSRWQQFSPPATERASVAEVLRLSEFPPQELYWYLLGRNRYFDIIKYVSWGRRASGPFIKTQVWVPAWRQASVSLIYWIKLMGMKRSDSRIVWKFTVLHHAGGITLNLTRTRVCWLIPTSSLKMSQMTQRNIRDFIWSVLHFLAINATRAFIALLSLCSGRNRFQAADIKHPEEAPINTTEETQSASTELRTDWVRAVKEVGQAAN